MISLLKRKSFLLLRKLFETKAIFTSQTDMVSDPQALAVAEKDVPKSYEEAINSAEGHY